MTAMDKKRELRNHWQRRAWKLILTKEDVLTVSRQPTTSAL
jgi:hypothetical protein